MALAACSGRELGGGSGPNALPASSSAGEHPSTAFARVAQRRKYGRLILHVTVPRRHGRHSHYIPGSAASITITLNTVNGSQPPAGTVPSTNSALTGCETSCTVAGPFAPPGSDNFTVTIFGGPAGNPGLPLSTASKTATIVAGTANTFSITLQGVPAKFALQGAMPAAAAGTALGATGIPIEVEDADGDVITGTYSAPVTIADPDTSSLTACSGICGSALQLSGGSANNSVVLDGSTDAANVQIRYGGLDIAPVALAASTSSGALTAVGSVTFSPSVAPVVYSGSLNGSSLPEIDLYEPLGGGTGSTGSFTDSQAGWTGSPYFKTIGESDNCNSGANAIATYAQTTGTNGTAWTATAVAGPASGSCTATLTGGAGATLAVTTTYTTGSLGISARRVGRASRSVKPPQPR
jgi:hypothetical protein